MSIEQWLQVRAYLRENRTELTWPAAALYPAARRVERTGLISVRPWLPGRPIRAEDVTLARIDWPFRLPGGWEDALRGVLPDRPSGPAHRTYSAAMAELDAPSVFENWPTYRLASAALTGPAPQLTFGLGTYFDGVDFGESIAHEFAAAAMSAGTGGELRSLIADPFDTSRRPVNVAITALTLRIDAAAGTATFPLHWRDPKRVGHAGGLYNVLPVGVFQPTGEGPANQEADFSLWRGMIREYAEEFLGEPELHSPDDRPIDYQSWPFAVRMEEERNAGAIRAWVLGLGVDPVTFATDLLAVVAFDAPVYDDLFGQMGDANSEGIVLGSGQNGLSLTSETIDQLTNDEPVQAAGAAVLRLAWKHRHVLLG